MNRPDLKKDLFPEVILGIAVAVLLLIGMILIAFIAPIVREQALAQKIFYYHVPSAWVAFLAFFVAFYSSIAYLRTGAWKWDIRAQAAVEVGIVFCTLVLISGPVWARPIWGSYWTWEPRLTTTLILFLIYIGYLLLRKFGERGERTSRFAAVVAIIGFLDVPLIFFAVKLWSPQVQAHPQVEMASQPGNILLPFLFMLFTFTLIFTLFLRIRVRNGMLEFYLENERSKE